MQLQDWIKDNIPWLGFATMAIVGGVVAHVREWDATHPGVTFKQHCKMLLRRGIMASLAGVIWYYITLGSNWQTSPFAFAAAALVGLFAPEFFDFVWAVGKRLFSRATGVEEPKNKE